MVVYNDDSELDFKLSEVATEGESYGVVVDAGSSGSRIYIYQWNTSEKRLLIKSDHQKKVTPGLSSLNLDQLKSHLLPLLEFASQYIPVQKHNQTPFYLFATAGMRLLPKDDSDLILKSCHELVGSFSNFYLEKDWSRNFRIIPGDLEAVFGWLAVNYLKSSLDAKQTFGFLDMGGASAQIAFQPADALASKYSKNLKSIKFRDIKGHETTFRLYLHSFLGFGMNEAFHTFNSNLAHGQQDPSKDIPHPCLPKGLQETFNNFTFFGTGDFDLCYKKATLLLNKEKKCLEDTPECYFDGTIIPLRDILNHHFLAVSEFWYTTDNVFDLGGVYNPESVRKASEKYCSIPWKNITDMNSHKQIPHVYDSLRLEQQCFKIAYIMNVLYEGLRLPSTNLNSTKEPVLQTIDKIDGIEPSWTLGAILMHVSANVLPNIEQNLSILKIGLLAMPILTAISIAFIHYKKKAKSQTRTFDMSQFHKQYVSLPQRLVD